MVGVLAAHPPSPKPFPRWHRLLPDNHTRAARLQLQPRHGSPTRLHVDSPANCGACAQVDPKAAKGAKGKGKMPQGGSAAKKMKK